MTIAVALGVPLGAWIGGHFGWRATFAGIGHAVRDRDARGTDRPAARDRGQPVGAVALAAHSRRAAARRAGHAAHHDLVGHGHLDHLSVSRAVPDG
ncbi:hypothetical protein [Burkholderia glumae]|uniref:hypothetical protein n=1 Tax=Burkholderia glumae TaxID=337 RepID=UPI0030C66AC0